MGTPHTPAAQRQRRSLPFARWLSWAGALLLTCLMAVLPARAQAPEPAAVLGETVQQVAMGYFHTCALTAAGAVQCWGDNGSGQLGDGSTTQRNTPQPVVGMASDVAAIAAGNSHTCALTKAGGVHCWGSNESGQLGDGSNLQINTPQPVTGLTSGVAAIAAGEYHTCALTTAGAVQCWGRNTFGALGDGSTTDTSVPQTVTDLTSGVAAIETGSFHTCALTTAGAVLCWGRNNNGQLGDGSNIHRNTPQPVSGMASGVAAIAAGYLHTCALTTAGAVQCWGDNGSGQLGDGGFMGTYVPQSVPGLTSGVAAIAAGNAHNCALTTAGAVQCWGANSLGQLGDGSTTDGRTPQPVTGLASGVAAIAAGGAHTCALTTAGAVQCWGRNQAGQLGDGTTTNKTTPQPVAGLASGVAAMTAGTFRTCALTKAGGVHCWGYNNQGQLGNGSTTHSRIPQPVTGLASEVAAIAAGYSHNCALTKGGGVQCWGLNSSGQLGDGSFTTRKTTPQPVTGLASGVAAIAGGGIHTCALTTAGAVLCWGHNGAGQLGDGTTTNSNVPQPVTGLGSGVAAIAAGYRHTCALTTAGAAQCWGYNLLGQLGDGSNTDSNTPQPVPGLASGVAAIAAAYEHTCALTTAGAVLCWGHNGVGQLGDGSNTDRNTPQSVTGLASGVGAIAAGNYHNCALTTAGAVQCWGSNSYGELGNDSTGNRNVPMRPAVAQAIDLPVPFGAPGAGTSSTLSATASSGLAVAFDSFTPDVCTVSGTTLTALPGKRGYLCGVQVRQAGGVGSDASYFAAAPTRSRLLLVAAGVPDAPTAVTASAGNAQATVTWTAPVSDGASALTAYTVTTVQDTAKTCTVTTGSPLPTTCTVTGLANGTAYTFTVKATNALGDSLASAASAPARPAVPSSGGGGSAPPTTVNVNSTGTTTLTDPTLPIIVGPGAVGATIVLPGTGTTPVPLQITVNGQPMAVTAAPGTQLQVAQVNGQSVLVLVVLQGSASMASTAAGQPMALAGTVLLNSGAAGTRIDAQPLSVAVASGSLVAPQGSLPELGGKGLLAGERLLVDAQGKPVGITLGSIKGEGTQPGDAMAFANLPASITVDGKSFARLGGSVARLAGANLAQGLEVAPSGVFMLRDGGQIFQLLPVQPITIDSRLPDGLALTPLGLLRWVRGGVVVQFAPAVADLAGLATAVATALPGATLKLGAEGVLQLAFAGTTYVLKPDWTGAGTATGTPQIGVDGQGRIVFQVGTDNPRQVLLPALLNTTQASSIFTAAIPGSVLAVQPGSSEGVFTLTLAGQQWRLVPQWVLPGSDAAQTTPWRMGADGVLYLKLGTQVQGVRITD